MLKHLEFCYHVEFKVYENKKQQSYTYTVAID